jgi:deoxycytidylate deaminase
MIMNNKAISKLFLERSKFVLIGLTGRTGSGCTTAANILELESPAFPSYEDATYAGMSFYQGLSKQRYNIVKKYAEENWMQFYSIKVSDLISAYLLSLTTEEMSEFILSSYTGVSVPKEQVDNLLNEGVFKNNYVVKEFGHFQNYVLNHEENNKPADDRLAFFIRYLKLVRKFTNNFKIELTNLRNDLYISTYQAAGLSIRKLGRVDIHHNESDFSPDSVFHLPETINRIIKIIRAIKERAFIVIDAIRNPYEARFFRDRYSAFYLVSINAPPKDRSEYLKNTRKFNIDQLEEIDKKESGEDKIPNKEFIGQNVKKCIEISDIHLFNPRNEINNHNVLKSQLAWYFSLMLHPGLISPTPMERIMQFAYTAKTNSGCISRQVGAVITDKNYSVKAIGWNDVPQGQYPCSLRSADGLLNGFDQIIYSEYERNNKKFRDVAANKFKDILINHGDLGGRNLAYCFKDLKNTIEPKEKNQVHTRSLHAEENAFLQIVKYGGQAIEGGKLFSTASPCELCAKKAYQLGIEEIIYIDPYPGIASDHILSIGSKVPKLIQFRGAVGKGYHQLYEPTLPYKDELEYFL